jgi:hypothetical protein
MIVFTRHIGRSKDTKEVYVYDINDVETGVFNHPYSYWKDLTPESSERWAIGDDGIIGEILSVRTYRINRMSSKRNTHVRLSYGANFIKHSTTILFETNFKNNSFEAIKPARWDHRLAKAKKTKFIAHVVAKMMLDGVIDYAKIGKLYRPDHLIPEATGRRFCKIETVKGLIMAEVDAILAEKGLTQGFVAESAKRMIDMAINSNDLRNGPKLLEIAGKWLSMEAPKVKQTESVTENVVGQIGETIKNFKLTKQLVVEGAKQIGS